MRGGAVPPGPTINLRHLRSSGSGYSIGILDNGVIRCHVATNGWCQLISEDGIVTSESSNQRDSFITAALAAYPEAVAGEDLVGDLVVGSSVPDWSSYVTI